MVICPKCGNKVASPKKTWPIPSRKGGTEGQPRKLAGIFECSKCKTRFRSSVEAKAATREPTDIGKMMKRIKGIRGELMQTLKNLREKIKTLETERSNLMLEIDKLRKVAESRANALEDEISMLREEVRSLRELLGYSPELEE